MPGTPPTEKRINIPLHPKVHEELRQRAKTLGVTMYELAAKAIEADLTDGTVSVSTDPGMGDVRDDEALSAIAGNAHAATSIARHYMNLNKPYLAAVMASVAAERMASGADDSPGDRKAASHDLTRFAGARLPRKLKIALFERAVALEPKNLVAKNMLGQQLYFDGQYAAAIEQLDAVRERDNRALLFHGFSLIELGLAAGDKTRARAGRDEVVDALEGWSFGNRDPQERQQWIRQLTTLDDAGPDFSHTVDELIEYANMNSYWFDSISRDDIDAAREALQPKPHRAG